MNSKTRRKLFIVMIITIIPSVLLSESEKLNGELINAVRIQDTSAVEKLLKAGANPNASVRDNGITPLMYASRKGPPELVRLLIQNGASVNATDKEGRTPLIWSVSGKTSLEIVTLLLENDADPNKRGSWDETALIIAAQRPGNSLVIETLVKHGATIDAFNKNGNTALIQAAFSGASDNVQALMKLGANPKHKNKGGFAAWSAAGSSGDIKTMALLGWQKTLLKTFAIAAIPFSIGLILYPFYAIRERSNAKRKQMLKRIFLLQLALNFLFLAIVLYGRFSDHFRIPNVAWPVVIGFIGLLGTILSLIAIWMTRQKLSTKMA